MRLFIAVRLSEEMKRALLRVREEMEARGVRGNFTREENLHLTLAFIGEYPDPEDAAEALGTVSFEPFSMALEGLGSFGDLWWAGMRQSEALETLARRVRRALAAAGLPFDRKRFSPHITLIRRASGRMPGVTIEPVEMTVRRVSLMRSDRGKNGMIYTELGGVDALPE